LLGARIVVVLKEIDELPLLPIHTKSKTESLGEETRLEVEYGIALTKDMLKVARGFYTNRRWPLEGRTNKATVFACGVFVVVT
jgi:hypothetical protein